MPTIDLDQREFGILKAFVLGRYEDLKEIVEDPNPKMLEEFRTGSREAMDELKSLVVKLGGEL